MNRLEIFEDIDQERKRQDAKYKKVNDENPDVMLAVLVEEVGEVARAIIDKLPGYYEELIQVAAVAVAMAERHKKMQE